MSPLRWFLALFKRHRHHYVLAEATYRESAYRCVTCEEGRLLKSHRPIVLPVMKLSWPDVKHPLQQLADDLEGVDYRSARDDLKPHRYPQFPEMKRVPQSSKWKMETPRKPYCNKHYFVLSSLLTYRIEHDSDDLSKPMRAQPMAVYVCEQCGRQAALPHHWRKAIK